ncbi:MAG TPA: sulfatase-like hydrolase/transferase [Chloroflexota bacterium]|nr:sulfatase-like hydrolase/transferase [Chloroflexota bacterium]
MTSATAGGARRPNILFFFTDDQRFDTIAALGHGQLRTPNMDALVRNGTAFTRAHIMGGSSGAVCMPSRAMLMTGRTLYHIDGEGQGISEEHVLLGEALQRAGYTTFGTGKWHNGPRAYARSFTSGAEIFFGGMDDHWNIPACHFDPSGAYAFQAPFARDPRRSNAVEYRRADHLTPGKHSSELFADAATSFLEEHTRNSAGTPFFAYVAFMAPHDPRTMPREYLEMYDPAQIELPPNYLPEHPFDYGEMRGRDESLEAWPRTEEAIRRHIAEYYAMITHLDAQIGRVMETLRRTGQEENTIVVFAGDNGLALGQHGLMGKQNLYDHSVRVPLIFSGPGVPRGQRSAAHAYLLDIYPTLCELVGMETPSTVEGKSLVAAVRDPSTPVRDVVLCAYRGLMRSARDSRYKLIEYAGRGQRYTQLFDVVEDPWEQHNLANDPARAGTVQQLRVELERWRTELDDHRPNQGESFWRTYHA